MQGALFKELALETSGVSWLIACGMGSAVSGG